MDTQSVLLGERRAERWRYLFIGIALGIIIVLLVKAILSTRYFSGDLRVPLFIGLGLLVSLVFAIYMAYRKRGLLVCLAIPTVVAVSVELLIDKFVVDWYWGLPIGFIAFVLGFGLQWGRSALRDGSPT